MFYFTCKHGLNIILTSGCQTTDLYAGEVWRISREQNVDISQAHIALAIWHSTCGKRYKHALRGVSTLVFVILNSTILMHYVLNLTKNYFRKSWIVQITFYISFFRPPQCRNIIFEVDRTTDISQNAHLVLTEYRLQFYDAHVRPISSYVLTFRYMY